MGRKCSVVLCKSGYANQEPDQKITIYRFPNDEVERKLWISCLPNKLDSVTKYMGVCSLHWPIDTPLIRKSKRGRYPVPTVPPSIFPNVPDSCVPSHTSCIPRPTHKTLSSIRNVAIDELALFRKNDLLKAGTFHISFNEKFSSAGLIAQTDGCVILFSTNRTGSIHLFTLYLTLLKDDNDDLLRISYEAYFHLKKISHPCINNTLKFWSELEEVVRFIQNYSETEDDVKLKFLCQAAQRYNLPKNSRLYSLEDLSSSFSWYSRSRALYSELRTNIQLPSFSTLKKITRIAKNLDDVLLFKSLFNKLEDRSKGCILIIDEVYVKASLTYRGGTIFGYSEDYPGKLATTFLCVMVKCFYGSKSFLVKLIPCHALKSDFQFKVICNVISTLEECGANVLGLICDNNRMNQRFFRLFDIPNQAQPWIANSPTSASRPLFLIYDPVHILKNIRNSWLTEKLQKICFEHNGVSMTAQWSDLKLLYEHESKHLLKLSSLTKSAVSPNNIEKQKVSLALQVFSDKTSAALKSSTVSTESCHQTAIFIDEVVRLWKVFNCKTPFQHMRHRDIDRAAVDLSERGSHQINSLLNWADIAHKLEPKTTPRVGTFTADTAKAIQWTCKCLVSLSSYLLETDAPFAHKYVTLGFFQQDDIERHFAHFRMSAGNNFYITAQDIFHTHAIDKTKLMLETKEEFYCINSDHSCDLCKKPLSDAELLLLDDLPDRIQEITSDEKLSLLYIGGYICQKHKDSPDLQGDSSAYPDVTSSYTDILNRGGLLFPSEKLFHLLGLIFTFFTKNHELSCRRRLIMIFTDFPNIFHLDLEMPVGSLSRIINIMMKRYCFQRQGENQQNKKRKIAKLTSVSQ